MTDSTVRPKVLIVEIERVIQDGLSRILKKNNFDIEIINDAEEALSRLDEISFDLLLIDLETKRYDGYRLTKEAALKNPDQLIVALTGKASVESIVQIIKAGANNVLTKPLTWWQVERIIDQVLKTHKLRQERDQLITRRASDLWRITTEKSRLMTVINSMAEGVMICDDTGSIIMCNPAFVRRMNLKQSCNIGDSIEDVPELIDLKSIHDDLFRAEPKVQAVTSEISVMGQAKIYLLVTVSRIVGMSGEFSGTVSVLRDITPIRVLEQKKSDFVAMVTHELRSPLASVDTQLHVLRKGLAGDLTEKQEEILFRIQKRISSLLELITNLLDLARIEAQTFVREKVETDINSIIGSIADELTVSAEAKQQELIFKCQNKLPAILADPEAIKEVLINLVSNSIRYTPEQGCIELETGDEAGYVYFQVKDNGIGISEKDIERIFDRFYRVKSERTRYVTGTGLGLPIVEAIVRDHLGYVRVASQPGEGTVFRVIFPTLTGMNKKLT